MTDGRDAAALQRLVSTLRERLAFVEGSKFWRLRSLWMAARARLGFREADLIPALPEREYVEAMDAGDAYTRWLLEHEPRAADLARLRDLSNALPDSPSIAAIVDAGNDPQERARTIAAVEAQAYGRVLALLASEGATAATRFNAALEASAADVVVFCSGGFELAPHAAFEAALAFRADPGLVAVYGDWDVLEADGARRAPVFAPAWSPETFLSTMYTGQIIFYRRDAVVRAGGFREGFGSALHYDLALRIFDETDRIAHRPSMLSHFRRTASRHAPHLAADDAARAVLAAIERRGERGSLAATPCAGVRIVRYEAPAHGLVDVIVPTRDLHEKLERCLRSVFELNDRAPFRVTVIDNGSVEPETARVLAAYARREPARFRTLRIDEPFNFSRLINAGVSSCDGTYVLLLNNDAAFVAPGGIEALREYASRPAIGAAGARLLYADGSLQHAGVVVGIGGYAGHVYRGLDEAEARTISEVEGVRNYSAVTAACMMVRRDAFYAAGGFDEGLAVEYNDIDFCLKLRSAGFRNVYLPHVVLRHDESSTRGPLTYAPTFVARERERFRERWHSDAFRDPYFNANLSRASERVRPAIT